MPSSTLTVNPEVASISSLTWGVYDVTTDDDHTFVDYVNGTSTVATSVASTQKSGQSGTLVYTDIGSSDFTTSAWIDIGTRVSFLSGHSQTRSKLARTAALPLVETPTRRSA